VADRIETAIRQNAGLIADKIIPTGTAEDEDGPVED
jgi:hypothetical protein